MTSLSWALGSSFTNDDKSSYITVTDNKNQNENSILSEASLIINNLLHEEGKKCLQQNAMVVLIPC